jgi:lipopolysaccharide biosynthesis glycosyltransferase
MKIVFCADRGILAALHVAAKSVLQSFNGKPEFVVITDQLESSEFELLGETLDATSKDYSLDFRRIDSKLFEKFPQLAGRHSTYFRLLIPDVIQDSRCLYLDSDIYCLCDLSALFKFDLSGLPLALVPEAPIEKSPDRLVFEMLGAKAKGHYFNAGVSLINLECWNKENLKELCFEFISENQPAYWDQSALNYVLHGRIAELPRHFNRMSNVRSNWHLFRSPKKCIGHIIHFVDFPKPWSFLGRWVHPMGNLWWKSYKKTAHFKKKQPRPFGFEWSSRGKLGYQKSIKDKILFSLYSMRLFLPKGVSDVVD